MSIQTNEIDSRASSFRDEFSRNYVMELDTRMQRSQVVGSVTYKEDNAVLFYDRQEDKFTLLIKPGNSEEAILYDSLVREQWGRKVIVFGHKTYTDGYVARGHATLNKKSLSIKITDGFQFYMDVDASAPFMEQFQFTPPKDGQRFEGRGIGGPPKKRQFESRGPLGRGRGPGQPRQSNNSWSERENPNNNQENDDFSEEDLRRLRGEIPIKEKRPF